MGQREAILERLSKGEISIDKASELLERVTEKENVPLSFKVSPKGCISVYGLARFPVTMYVDQWERLIARVPELQAFAEANKDRLTRK